MDYTTKLAYQSNYWYNDGLKKANIRICRERSHRLSAAYNIIGLI